MKRKEYEREMRLLHGELVAMQEWVKASGAKICIVFEGRDTAGKGGTIKRITERVSPRVFRVVALPTPTEREKSQMYVQRYIPHFPAVSRPSNTMQILAPDALTHSCMATSSPCRILISRSYSLRFIFGGGPPSASCPAAAGGTSTSTSCLCLSFLAMSVTSN